MRQSWDTLRCHLRMTVLRIGLLLFMPLAVAEPNDSDDQTFVPMFNGHDMSGWETTGNWVCERGGVISLEPKPRRFRLVPNHDSFLWTEESYDDFILDIEFKVPKNGSSGVFVRTSSPRSYIQAQIRDSYGKKEPLSNRDCGAVVGLVAPSKNMSKPAGQWNRMIITCQRNRMQVELNGEQVVNLDLYESKITRTISAGRIGLENTNKPVAFRNVRIKELR